MPFAILYLHPNGATEQFGPLFDSVEQAKAYGSALPPAQPGALKIYNTDDDTPVCDLGAK